MLKTKTFHRQLVVAEQLVKLGAEIYCYFFFRTQTKGEVAGDGFDEEREEVEADLQDKKQKSKDTNFVEKRRGPNPDRPEPD